MSSLRICTLFTAALVLGLVCQLAAGCRLCTYRTPWYDVDNVGGNGDNESIDVIMKLRRTTICGNRRPIGAECKRAGSSRIYNRYDIHTSGDNLRDGYKCDPDRGAICEHRHQRRGHRCRDWSIRFICPSYHSSCSYWSGWSDRDNPSGYGDNEDPLHLRTKPCAKTTPVNAQCGLRYRWWFTQRFGRYDSAKTRYLDNKCTPRDGLICENRKQPSRRCGDYGIRYQCMRPGRWTGWYDRDRPSGYGDYESLQLLSGQSRHRICGGLVPLYARCRVHYRGRWREFDYTSLNTAPNKLRKGFQCSPDTGTICENRDQPRGSRCLNYQIKFQCPITYTCN